MKNIHYFKNDPPKSFDSDHMPSYLLSLKAKSRMLDLALFCHLLCIPHSHSHSLSLFLSFSLLFPPEFWQEQIALPHIYRLVWIRQCFPDICERRWLRCNFSCEHIFCGHSCPLYCDLFVKKGRWGGEGEHSVINDFCRDVSAEIGQAEMREPQITLKEKWDRAGVWCSRSWFDEISQKLFSSGVVLEI